MKHVSLRPETGRRHYARLFFEDYWHIRRGKRTPTASDALTDSPEKNEILEKPPIGIEAGMVYIAIPAGLAAWACLIFFVTFLFF
jgi:hypothetical protein